MEEPSGVYSDDNNALPEKKHKRKVKTPSQVEALEKLYEEHKYPTESMKLQLAKSIGLTEKQISGWLCHKRTKDKKLNDDNCANGRQDRSSGVVQDRGSGLKQDSCGSTKQGDHRHREPREVESRRFTGVELPAADITYERGSGYIQNHSDTDDTSSGSERYMTQKGNIGRIDVKGSKRRTGPSGYLKVIGQSEHVAITSVKRQLGSRYIQDGPPLGIDFDPPPPGAFESPVRDPDGDSDFIGEPILPHSSYDSRTFKQPPPSRAYEEYNSKMGSQDSDLDGPNYQMMHGSNSRKNYSHLNSQKRPGLSYQRNPVHKQFSSMEMNGDSEGEEQIYGMKDNYEMKAKHDAGRAKESFSSHHLPPYGRKFTGKQRERFESPLSSFPVKSNKFLHSEERELSRRATKEGVIYGDMRGNNEYSYPINATAHPANEIRPAKRSREDFPHQQHTRKAPMGEMTPWTNPSRRSRSEVTSSFSEHETSSSAG